MQLLPRVVPVPALNRRHLLKNHKTRRKTLLEKIRRNAFFIAAAFFLWQGWSSADASPPKTDEEETPATKVPVIRESFLRNLEQERGEVPADPFALLQKVLAAQEVNEEEGVGNFSDTDSALVQKNKRSLRLESTFRANHNWIARINGHSLREGEALPGFDEKQPPILVFVQGTQAILEYDGQQIRLDLAGEASVLVDQ